MPIPPALPVPPELPPPDFFVLGEKYLIKSPDRVFRGLLTDKNQAAEFYRRPDLRPDLYEYMFDLYDIPRIDGDNFLGLDNWEVGTFMKRPAEIHVFINGRTEELMPFVSIEKLENFKRSGMTDDMTMRARHDPATMQARMELMKGNSYFI